MYVQEELGFFQPKLAWLTVNRNCNFRCPWCIVKTTNYQPLAEMSFDLAAELADVVKAIGISTVVLIGGEPTLWKPLSEFNSYCHNKLINTCIATNGCMFGDDDFWEKYCESPCNSVYLSIKSIRKSQFAAFTASAQLFEQTLKGIRRVLRYHDDVGVEMVLSKLTSAYDIIDTGSYVKKHGAQSFTLDLCADTDPNYKFSVSDNNLAELVQTVHSPLDELFGTGLTLQLFAPLCLWDNSLLAKMQSKNQLPTMCQRPKLHSFCKQCMGECQASQ